MTSNAPAPRPGILDIVAYVPGQSHLASGAKAIKLSSNETPLGPSPRAVEAYQRERLALNRYPDGQASKLRAAIAARFGLNPDRIVCGAGSDELLNLLAQGYLGPGDEAIHTEHGFLVYEIATRATGAVPVVAPERNLTADVDAILGKVSTRTKIIFLANPNNPTGTYLPFDEVRRLRQGLPADVLLVLDGAYAEYVRRNDYEAGIELVGEGNNTIMTRTFSKIHGLAALRIGWAYCPANIAAVLNRIRGPFNLSGPAIAAGIAAMSDPEFVERAVAFNDEWLAWTAAQLRDLGLKVSPSVANFLLLHFPDDKPAFSAAAADAFLQSKAIILRRVAGYGLPNALRMSIGTEDENRAVVAALAEFMQAGQSSGMGENGGAADEATNKVAVDEAATNKAAADEAGA